MRVCTRHASQAGSLTVIVPVTDVKRLRTALEHIQREIREKDLVRQRIALRSIAPRLARTNTATGEAYEITATDFESLLDALTGTFRNPRATLETTEARNSALAGSSSTPVIPSGFDWLAAPEILQRGRIRIPAGTAEALRKAVEEKLESITAEDIAALRTALEDGIDYDIDAADLTGLGGLLGGHQALTAANALALRTAIAPRPPVAVSRALHAHAQLAAIDGIHVARWVVLPERVRLEGRETPPSLVMWTVFDGDERTHIETLVTKARALLDRIYVHCGGYATAFTKEELTAYLLRHKATGRVAAFDGTPGRSVELVVKQAKLADILQQFLLDTRDRKSGIANKHLFLEARRFVDEKRLDGNCSLACFARTRLDLPKPPGLSAAIAEAVRTVRAIGKGFSAATALFLGATLWLSWRWAGAVAAALGFGSPAHVVFFPLIAPLAFAVLAAPVAAVFLWMLRRSEARDEARWVSPEGRKHNKHDSDLVDREDEHHDAMNPMTIVTDLKPGYLHRVLTHAVLGLVAFQAARNQHGSLQGIETIHFAQWRLVDDGSRLLFMSNYDGRASAYVGEFSHKAAAGINAIWGTSRGFPPTWFLVGGGARDEDPFWVAARAHQIPTDVWYAGYPDPARARSVKTINRNWRIHAMLTSHATPGEIDAWVESVLGEP